MTIDGPTPSWRLVAPCIGVTLLLACEPDAPATYAAPVYPPPPHAAAFGAIASLPPAPSHAPNGATNSAPSTPASTAKASAPGAFVAGAWPAIVPQLETSASCDSGTCSVPIALSSSIQPPATVPAPARLWEHRLAAGTTLSIPKDDALTVLGVVLEGAVKDERSAGEPRTLLVDDDGQPLPEQALGLRTGFFYRGGGFSLRAENNQPARVLLAVVQRRDSSAFKASGAVWSQRPTGYLDSIDHFDFLGPTQVFGAGKLNAIIGLQDHEEAAPVFAVKAPDPKGREPAPPAALEQAPVTWKPDASCSLLGVQGGAEVAQHVHEGAWEFLAVLSGEGELRLGASDGAQSSVRSLRPGSLVAIPASLSHAFKARDGAPVIALQLYTPPGPERSR